MTVKAGRAAGWAKFTSKPYYRGSNPLGTGIGFTGVLGHGNALTITGLGFGTGINEAFYDRGDVVRENGIDNTYHSTFADNQIVYGGDGSFGVNQDATAIYARPSKSSITSDFVAISTATAEYRHVRNGCHYENRNSLGGTIGWPMSMVTVSGSDPIPNSPQQDYIYTAFYMWWEHDFTQLHTFKYNGASGLPFTAGENITLSYDARDCTFIGVYNDGVDDWIVLKDGDVSFDKTTWDELVTYTATGDISGASVTLQAAGGVNDNTNGPEKIIRVWDDIGGANTRTTLAQATLSANGINSDRTGGTDDYIWNGWTSESTWTFVEFEYDVSVGTIKSYFNGSLHGSGTGVPDDRAAGQQMVPATIGWESIRCRLNNIRFGELYADHQKKRVIFTDAATWGTSTKFELQPVDSWADEGIVIEQHFGALGDGDSKYCYIISDGTYPSVSDAGVLVSV